MFNLTRNQCQDKEYTGEPHELGTAALAGCHSCLVYLNEARLLHKVIHNGDSTIDVQLNVQNTLGRAKKFVADKTLDELHTYLLMMQAFTAQVSLLYTQSTKELADPSLPKRKSGDDFKRALEESRRAAMTNSDIRAEKAKEKVKNKHLSDFDKAVRALTAAGLTQEDAINTIREQFKSQGKHVE